jgi:hypothetical protein
MYQQSAAQKFTKAQLSLAQLYYQGRLSEKDDVEALKLALNSIALNLFLLLVLIPWSSLKDSTIYDVLR